MEQQRTRFVGNNGARYFVSLGLQFVLIGAIPCSSTSHTADLVDELLDESFLKLGFHNAQSAVFTSVSDNGSNMVAGISAGGRFPCVCHTPELSVKKGCDIPEISCVLKKSSKLVAHFGRSTISANKLKEHQLRAALKRKKVIKMVLTRWRSHRDMSASIVISVVRQGLCELAGQRKIAPQVIAPMVDGLDAHGSVRG